MPAPSYEIALDVFTEVSAQPWADRARQELRASGETTRKRDPSTSLRLAPQEQRIASLVSRGHSNADVAELTRWTPGASFPPGHRLRYERYGLGMGTDTLEGVELLGHTGFIGAFAFHAPKYDAVLTGAHSASQVDRWPLVAALCRELRQAACQGRR